VVIVPVKFGQHFLKNGKILEEIAKYAEISSEDIVLEIGAGIGNLTEKLAKAKKIYAVEIDKKLFVKLKRNLEKYKNVECINEDILKYEFPEDVNKIVGNLPYEISSLITEKILRFLNKQKLSGVKNVLAVLMYQKEFAERMTAFPGIKDYSRLSVLVNYYADVEILRIVGKSEFRPAPRVDSALVKIIPKGVKENEELFKLTKILFMHKNKKVINALIDARNYLSIKEKDKLKDMLPELLGDLGDRKVFYLEIEELIEIHKRLKGKLRFRV